MALTNIKRGTFLAGKKQSTPTSPVENRWFCLVLNDIGSKRVKVFVVNVELYGDFFWARKVIVDKEYLAAKATIATKKDFKRMFDYIFKGDRKLYSGSLFDPL
jgi:hypothetical protein